MTRDKSTAGETQSHVRACARSQPARAFRARIPGPDVSSATLSAAHPSCPPPSAARGTSSHPSGRRDQTDGPASPPRSVGDTPHNAVSAPPLYRGAHLPDASHRRTRAARNEKSNRENKKGQSICRSSKGRRNASPLKISLRRCCRCLVWFAAVDHGRMKITENNCSCRPTDVRANNLGDR